MTSLSFWGKNTFLLLSSTGAVGSFRARATTIIAVLIWEGEEKQMMAFIQEIFKFLFFISKVWRNRTGNTPIIDFTAEMRKQPEAFSNNSDEDGWELLDPHHITPNARQLEVYHLKVSTI